MVYVASVRDTETNEIKVIESDYPNKKCFYRDLRANGYRVRFISYPDSFDSDCIKWYNKHGDFSGGIV